MNPTPELLPCREAFEKWYAKERFVKKFEPLAWDAWQAAWNAPRAQSGEKAEALEDFTSGSIWVMLRYDQEGGQHMMRPLEPKTINTIKAALSTTPASQDITAVIDGLDEEAFKERLKLEIEATQKAYESGDLVFTATHEAARRYQSGQHASETDEQRGRRELWEMVVDQDTPELRAGFMVNWLRGTIKIPENVQQRIFERYQSGQQAAVPDGGIVMVPVEKISRVSGLRSLLPDSYYGYAPGFFRAVDDLLLSAAPQPDGKDGV